MALAPAEKQRRYRERRKSPPSTTESPVVPVRNAGAMRWLGALQEHYRDSFDSLPDSLRDTAYGERLQIIVEADIEALKDIEPPRGYGRDTRNPIDHGNVTMPGDAGRQGGRAHVTMSNGRQPAAGTTSCMSPRSQDIDKAEPRTACGQPRKTPPRTPAKALQGNMDACRIAAYG